jgi:hypothetical protein
MGEISVPVWVGNDLGIQSWVTLYGRQNFQVNFSFSEYQNYICGRRVDY